jgi:hypothetical protein
MGGHRPMPGWKLGATREFLLDFRHPGAEYRVVTQFADEVAAGLSRQAECLRSNMAA